RLQVREARHQRLHADAVELDAQLLGRPAAGRLDDGAVAEHRMAYAHALRDLAAALVVLGVRVVVVERGLAAGRRKLTARLRPAVHALRREFVQEARGHAQRARAVAGALARG